jgi:competence protein ComEC
MLIRNSIPFWKSSPFVRLLLPLVAGILLQWYLQFSLLFIIFSFASFFIAFLLFRFLPLAVHFKVQWLQGISINLLLLSFGLFITWQKDIRNHEDWFGNYYRDEDQLVVKIDEPLIAKAKSYKANASVEALIDNDSSIDYKGRLILYFSKDSTSQKLQYGDEILIHKLLQPIRNIDSLGFDYEQYEAFRQTFHSVFLKNNDWILLKDKDIGWLDGFIFKIRQHILSVLHNNIPNDEDQQAIASALLIGYNNDIDKELKQAYANTGVVYLIAVSGMSLGLLYILLVGSFSKIPVIRRSKWMELILVVCCLWIFALLTGASAAVLRSAIMFTCIAVGKAFNRKASIYNSIAASAFILLCYDPYFLWNISFQISYLAMISIVVFQKPVYDLIYVKNKWLDKIWQMIAVALSVQILTLPICIYYFQQFPVLFLITNVVAIPLATIILFAELLLLSFSWVAFAGSCLGKLITYLTGCMDHFILWINGFPFAVINNISISLFTTGILYGIIISFSSWRIHKRKAMFLISLSLVLLLTVLSFKRQYMVLQTIVQESGYQTGGGQQQT